MQESTYPLPPLPPPPTAPWDRQGITGAFEGFDEKPCRGPVGHWELLVLSSPQGMGVGWGFVQSLLSLTSAVIHLEVEHTCGRDQSVVICSQDLGHLVSKSRDFSWMP